jgi:hypothetical protein
VAPSNSAYNTQVTARVTQLIRGNACRLGGGADLVTIGIYYNGASYGQVTYAHLIASSSLYVGKAVPRWGTYLGYVATSVDPGPAGSDCWTGPHVHTELRATTQYACWNRGYILGSSLQRTNFIGFVSGPLATYARACP